ncbi:MAG: hypothetical protein AAFP23_04085 [Pseudomonadota bacterium]
MSIEPTVKAAGFEPQADLFQQDLMSPPSARSMMQFEHAMRTAAAEQPVEPVQVAQAGGTPPVERNDALSPTERALQVFDPTAVQAAGAVPTTGTTILEGLKNLRGAFDAQTTNLAALQNSNELNSGQMLGLQVEVVKYGLLIDVTSKLTGKSTQAFDTLLKGQ